MKFELAQKILIAVIVALVSFLCVTFTKSSMVYLLGGVIFIVLICELTFISRKLGKNMHPLVLSFVSVSFCSFFYHKLAPESTFLEISQFFAVLISGICLGHLLKTNQFIK